MCIHRKACARGTEASTEMSVLVFHGHLNKLPVRAGKHTNTQCERCCSDQVELVYTECCAHKKKIQGSM